MIPAPAVDERRVESFYRELLRFAPHYTPDLNLLDKQGVGVALMRIFAQLAETVAVRLDQTPQKNFIEFLHRLGITLLPARAARVPVTFRLVQGLEQPVQVPAGTRVTSPGVSAEIPFETNEALLAIPGALKALYGADPLKDKIFSPPLGFLNQEPRTPTELSYQIQSFVAKDSNRLQLNHTTELATGSFIRIDCKEKRVIEKVDEAGNFVMLSEPVGQDFESGTVVVPIRNFEVFDGIDRQEHILYIGHATLFTVKEKVEITLEIELSDDEPSQLEPLDLTWQFWTKNENAVPEEVEHWEDLTLKFDGTQGLSRSGRVVLVKPNEREIKPRQVGPVEESRWIRAKLKDKLPVGSRRLPEIETVKASVTTGVDVNGKQIGILADQGFHNATPLDVQIDSGIGFFPFGIEPRQFDQFYVASGEAFSKRDAAVKLQFDLELRTLGAPSVVNSNLGLRSYSLGLRRRLYGFDVTRGTWDIFGNPFENQGVQYLPTLGSAPSAVSDADDIFVFVKTEDALAVQDPANKIWAHSHKSTGTTPNWFDLDAPAQKRVRFNPFAIHRPSSGTWQHIARVFVVGADGNLYSHGYPGGAGWDAHGSPVLPTSQAVKLDSTPFAVEAGSKIFVFVNGEGNVHWLTLESNLTGTWKSLTPSSASFTAGYRPFAQSFVKSGVDHAKVFTFAFKNPNDKTTGRLFECDTSSEDIATHKFDWDDLGQPPVSAAVEDDDTDAHAPNGYVEKPSLSKDGERKHIFLRGADKKLYERLDDPVEANPWQMRSRPADPDLRDSTSVIPISIAGGTRIHVFSASSRNSLVEWIFEELTVTVPSLANAEKLGVLLDRSRASTNNGEYNGKTLKIVSGPGSPPSNQITAYDGELALARVATQQTTLPDRNSQIEINVRSLGNARDDADHLLAIHVPASNTSSARPLYVQIDDGTSKVFVKAEFYSRITGIISLRPSDFPTTPADFALYSALTNGGSEFNSPEDTGTVPELSWEYWNGRGWLSLKNAVDGTRNLLRSGDVSFEVPKDIESTEVAGQENHWIRARLVGGDYGRETFRVETTGTTQKIISDRSSLSPPKVRKLRVSYNASPVFPEACLTFNNLDYLDQTAACENANSHFPPFVTLEDESPTLFFGFDKTFKTGPVGLLLDAAERNYNESKPPELAWSFRKDKKWKKLDAEDGSGALMRQGILKLNAPEELTLETRFGDALFWIKGSLRIDRALADIETISTETEGKCGEPVKRPSEPCAEINVETKTPCSESSTEDLCGCSESKSQTEDPSALKAAEASALTAAAIAEYPPPLLLGVFLNTVWVTQGETITEEIFGSGDGEPNQKHSLQHGDVLEGEDIRVEETLSTEERERIVRQLGIDSVIDREDIGGTWVRWRPVKALFDCSDQDRCYEIDRAAGELRFGDGASGRTVPAGVDNIRAFSYRTGGGSVGNVSTNQVNALVTAVAGIESVFNPAPAGGGSDKADTKAMLTIGPRRLSHRDRAVSAEDFEELAYEASRQIAKVRCLATTNLIRAGPGRPDPCDARQLHEALTQRGYVSLIIVPHSAEARPCPSLQLRRAVREYLSERAPGLVASSERIVVRPPDYVIVSVKAKLFVASLEVAAMVESEARTALETFLHPVNGGPEGKGWDFGRPVTKSDVFALLERIREIDRIENLEFLFRGQRSLDRVEIDANELLASGEHALEIKKA